MLKSSQSGVGNVGKVGVGVGYFTYDSATLPLTDSVAVILLLRNCSQVVTVVVKVIICKRFLFQM